MWVVTAGTDRLPSGQAHMDISLLPYRPDRDVYRLLGVAPNAGRVEIVAACRRLARAFHPDRNGSQRATEEMQVVNAVRSLLTDPETRAEYDQERLSFLQTTVRPGSVQAPRSMTAERAAPPAFARTAQAAMAGMLAALKALSPGRCASCNAAVEPSYRFCGGCGAPL
jgi:curved DNA-binding protein CbpA